MAASPADIVRIAQVIATFSETPMPRTPRPSALLLTRTLTLTFAVALALAVALAVALPSRLVSQPRLDITRLGWMAGCWEQRSGASVTHESWMAPAGGAMVGMSRTVTGGAFRAWEALRIVTDSGRLAYIAQPNGRAPTAFPATVTSDTLAVFENPAHDFPQRIAYRRLSADSLVARVSAERDGRSRGMDIAMQRVHCGG